MRVLSRARDVPVAMARPYREHVVVGFARGSDVEGPSVTPRSLRNARPPAAPRISLVRGRLLAGTAALAVLQLVHLLDTLRYDDTASFPSVLVDRQAAIGIGFVTVAFFLLIIEHPSARTTTIGASVVVAVGFVLHHGIPVVIGGVTNPYWTAKDGNRADWFRWTTVLVLIALGIWTATSAWRARALLDEP
ncbi:MAG: hypothetical protein JWL83_2175 [Actinomycetia bacterium]|nr:hypothetical protein [Actinomycetes bacterium]